MSINFTIVTLARNEENRLPLLLRSLATFLQLGGEVVVADSGSVDNTREIARAAGCKVLELGDSCLSTVSKVDEEDICRFLGSTEIKFQDQVIFDFGKARNAAADAASSDYILALDAGDRVANMNIGKINEALLAGSMYPIIHFLEEGSKHASLRFYNRTIWKYFSRVHEYLGCRPEITECGEKVLIPPDDLKIVYTRQVTVTRNYIYGLYQDMLEYPSHRVYFYLGRELFYAGQWASAIKIFTQGYNYTGWNAERSQAMVYAGMCHVHLNNLEGAQLCYYKALNEDSTRREPWIRLAYIAQAQKNYSSCVGFATGALMQPRRIALYEDERNYTAIPYHLAYWGLLGQNRITEAYVYWQQCLTNEPESSTFKNDAKYFINMKSKA